MTQALVLKTDTFDQDDLNKTIEEARQEAVEISSLARKSKEIRPRT